MVPALCVFPADASAYFFSLLSSLKGYSMTLVFRNELGTSLPVVIKPRTANTSAAVLASLVRDTDAAHDDIQHATWIGYHFRHEHN